MTNQEKCRILAEAISSDLSQGITLAPETIQYIESTFGISTPPALFKLFQEQEETEKESILQLIFFPDRETRKRLEPILEREKFATEDIEEVASLLAKKIPIVSLYPPGVQEAIQTELQTEHAAGFVSRLYIQRKLPRYLSKIIDHNFSSEFATRIKVDLRCAKFEQNATNLELLETVFNRLDLEDMPWKLFNYILTLLEESKSNEDLWHFFKRKKIFIKQHLEKAKYIEKQVSSQPMELLMMQGVNTLSISSSELSDQLHMLQDICLQTFGVIPGGDNFQPVQVEKDNLHQDPDGFMGPDLP
ncbi:MAG: hypothetical protein ACOCZ2_05030 [Thermodesulfobacteriota bacterium]